jgi:uncharacterized protein (TIGR03118 family)
MRTWFRRLSKNGLRTTPAPKRRGCRPALEALEQRCLMASGFIQANLTSDIPGLARVTDPNLVNAWGLAVNPATNGFMWVNDNGTGLSTLYDNQGNINSLVVSVPGPSSDPGATSSPTGIVFNPDRSHYMVTENGKTGSAAFLFATEDGTISGWSPGVDLTHAVLGADNSDQGEGAVYKGLALGTTAAGGAMIYAANFRTGHIDVFDDTFQPRSVAGHFLDPSLPRSYAPFNIRNIGGKLYVAYAKQDAAKHDDVAGAGHGFIDVFDTDGHLLTPQHLVSRGQLDSPWGLALAPSNFGPFGGDLLVGNFGNGKINAYDPTTGAFKGTMKDLITGRAIVIPGLWGLEFGNSGTTGPSNTLFFGAGPFGESHGLYGSLTAVTVPGSAAVAGSDGQVALAQLIAQGLPSGAADGGTQVGPDDGGSPAPVGAPQGDGGSASPVRADVKSSSSSAAGYVQTNLVSDIPGVAPTTDPNLVNPWGLVASSTSPWWLSDNGTGLSTLYNGNTGAIVPLVVSVATPSSGDLDASAPTGIVFNTTANGFQVSKGTTSGKSAFIFDTEDGTVSGWAPSVDGTHALLGADNSDQGEGAVYKGLALGTTAGGNNMLYAANFRTGHIDVFNDSFQPRSVAGHFADPNLPRGYAPFDIANIGGKLYVTYAKQNAEKHDDVAGAGHGFIDVFDTDGHLLQRLVSRGKLDSPWGLAVAPQGFGAFSGDLLVGNFGNGKINAYDPITGDFKGTMKDLLTGRDIVIPGLWALQFGNGAAAGPKTTLFFTAGIFDENHGLFGELTAVPVPGGASGGGGGQGNLARILLQGLSSDTPGSGVQAGNNDESDPAPIGSSDGGDGAALQSQGNGKLSSTQAAELGRGDAKAQSDAQESNSVDALDRLFGQGWAF